MPTIEDAVAALAAKNFAAAWALLAELARSGDIRAMQLLGLLHAAGEGGRPADPGLAAFWFFQAWQAGLDEAEQDIVRIRPDLEAAAENGSADAQNALGLILCFGHDDPATAAAWFERARSEERRVGKECGW